MNNLLYSILICISITTFAVSCKSGSNDLLTKKWKVSEFTSPSMDKLIKDQLAVIDTIKDDSMKIMMKDEMTKMMKDMNDEMLKMEMDLKSDNTFTVNGGGVNDKGNWSISADNKYLITTSNKGAADSILIESMSADKLVLKQIQGEDEMTLTFIPIMHGETKK